MSSAPSPHVTPLRVRGLFLKWLYLACLLAGPIAVFGFRSAPASAPVAAWSFAASMAMGVAWFANAWANVPPEDRHFTPFGRHTAFDATARLFIPVYGLYWTFKSLSLLSTAINAALARRALPMRVPLGLGIVAPIVAAVSSAAAARDLELRMMAECAAGGLWFFFMVQADHARRFVILACLAERERIAAARAAMDAKERA